MLSPDSTRAAITARYGIAVGNSTIAIPAPTTSDERCRRSVFDTCFATLWRLIQRMPARTIRMPPTVISIRCFASVPGCGNRSSRYLPGPSATRTPGGEVDREEADDEPAERLDRILARREVDARHERGRVHRVDEARRRSPVRGDAAPGQLDSALGRGLTERVAFSSSASVDHLLWALAGVPHTILRSGITLLAPRTR